jgi:OmpA-OmpF porin, OOP family
LLCAAAFAGDAVALEGFALNRFEPAERGSYWFSAESLEFTGNNRWAVGFVGDMAQGPLIAREPADGQRVTLIDSQSFVHAGASVVLSDRFRLGFGAPLLAYQRASAFEADGVSVAPREGAALGDVRLGADVRFFGHPGDVFSAGAGVRLYLPTGDREAFASDGAVRVAPQLHVAGELGHFVYAGSLSVQLRRGPSDFSDASGGSELGTTLAAGVRLLDHRLVIGPELWGSTVISGGDAFLKRSATPFELVLGAHYDVVDDLRIALGVGPGLSQGLGSPALRALAAIEWAPTTEAVTDSRASLSARPEPQDRDGDGVADADDRCPDRFGMQSSDQTLHGCPPWDRPAQPADSDGDGISDPQDSCIAEPGMANPFDPTLHGCPQRPGAYAEPSGTPPAPAPEGTP